MGLFDLLKQRKEDKLKGRQLPIYKDSEVSKFLDAQITSFFPKGGTWYNNCFARSKEHSRGNLPCHLRNNKWLSALMQKELAEKGIVIPRKAILEYMNTSKLFNELRHEYELKIVEWQIDWMMSDGEGWLMPEGCGEFSLMFSPKVDEWFRAGIVKTLTAIGMDREVIEEGIEKNPNWREEYFRKSFSRAFEPIIIGTTLNGAKMPPADKELLQNYLRYKEYKYYKDHKASVDKYGKVTQNMLLSDKEVDELVETLRKQTDERKAFIENFKNEPPKYKRFKKNDSVII